MSVESRNEVRELISKARLGNEKALGELISRYEPLTMSLLSRYSNACLTREDAEDIKQETLIIFCNAVMKYNLSQDEVDFGLYAKICMERGIVSQLRVISRRARIEQMSDEEFPHTDDPSLGVIEGESVREMWKLINENLSDYENKVWNLHLSGKSPAEIAEQLGRDVKSTDNALCRIRAKLRKALKRQNH